MDNMSVLKMCNKRTVSKARKTTLTWGWLGDKPAPSGQDVLMEVSMGAKGHLRESQYLRSQKPPKPRIVCSVLLESLIES